MAKPTTDPEWASDALVLSGPEVGVGVTPREEPAAGIKQQGFVANQNFVGRYVNWWMNLVYQWVLYLGNLHNEVQFLNKTYSWTASHAFTAGLTGTTAAMSGNISTSGGTVTAQNGVTATTGGVTATAGGVTATAGNIVATAGNISATAGSVSAGTTVTGATGVTATTGNVTATAGDVVANGNHTYNSTKTITKILPNENGRPYGTTLVNTDGLTYWVHFAYSGTTPNEKDFWQCSAVDAVDRPWLIFPLEGIPDGATITKIEADVYHAGGASATGAVYLQKLTPNTGASSDSDITDTAVIADGAGPVAVASRVALTVSQTVDADAYRFRVAIKPPRNVALGVGGVLVTFTTTKVTNDTQ